jgi:hypothetical protein
MLDFGEEPGPGEGLWFDWPFVEFLRNNYRACGAGACARGELKSMRSVGAEGGPARTRSGRCLECADSTWRPVDSVADVIRAQSSPSSRPRRSSSSPVFGEPSRSSRKTTRSCRQGCERSKSCGTKRCASPSSCPR